MKRLTLLGLGSLLCLLGAAVGPVAAQAYPYNRPNYGPGYRPPLSPYLDIIRGGDPAINYFLGTRTELDRRAKNAQFRSALLDLEQRTLPPVEEDPLFSPVPSTGHRTAFGNTATYFGTSQPRVPSATRPPTGPRPRRN